MTTEQILINANKAKVSISLLTNEQRNQALLSVANELLLQKDNILQANAIDVAKAQGLISPVMIDRLLLDEKRIAQMAQGIKDVAKLPDPLGRELSKYQPVNGLKISKISVPMGVIAIIYESRPNVTSDCAALCLKSGNVCVLRCGKEAHESAQAIVDAIHCGLKKVGVLEDAVQLIEDTTRESANQIMSAVGLVDLLIPRGGAGLIQNCVQNAKIPCIHTGTGICHIYVDKDANQEMALDIIKNAKCSRPSVCNAAEVCLVHQSIASVFLPKLWQILVQERAQNKVILKLDAIANEILLGKENCLLAASADFDTEFLDYVLAVKVVKDIDEGILHIQNHSTGHSEAIITDDDNAADKFTRCVDSAAVYVNASTRFTDGGEFGLGCEIGISTQKMHARGPMGLQELTSYKYVIVGKGNIR